MKNVFLMTTFISETSLTLTPLIVVLIINVNRDDRDQSSPFEEGSALFMHIFNIVICNSVVIINEIGYKTSPESPEPGMERLQIGLPEPFEGIHTAENCECLSSKKAFFARTMDDLKPSNSTRNCVFN